MPVSQSQKNEIVLVVAAHHDDEVLGCGGTLIKHKKNGDSINLAFLADGFSSRKHEGDSRDSAAKKVAKQLGNAEVLNLGLPDNKMDSVSLLEVVQKLEKVIKKVNPTVIYTHHFGDLNIDHQIAHKAVMTACRPQPGSTVRKILSFEILSSTEWTSPSMSCDFKPNYFVNISDYVTEKLELVECYADEMRDYPHSRSLENIKNLFGLRGASVGFEAAEAFQLERGLEN